MRDPQLPLTFPRRERVPPKRPAPLDVEEGERQREDAIQRAEDHADESWKTVALQAVLVCAVNHQEFTTDAVWARMPRGAQTHEPRAMGAIMRRAESKGWIAHTDRTEMSRRPQCHRRPVRVWLSRKYARG